jgi:hypothetical protein
MHAPRKPDTRMPMSITMSDYLRLPKEDRHDPSVLWVITPDVDPPRGTTAMDYFYDGPLRNWEWGL